MSSHEQGGTVLSAFIMRWFGVASNRNSRMYGNNRFERALHVRFWAREDRPLNRK